MNQTTNVKQLDTRINENEVMAINIEENTDNIFDEETVKSLLRSEEDIEKGRTRKAADVIKELEEKYGF